MVQQQLCWRFAGSSVLSGCMDVLKGCEALSGNKGGGGNEGFGSYSKKDFQTSGRRLRRAGVTTSSVMRNVSNV